MKKRILKALLRKQLAAFIEKTYLTVAASQPYVRNYHIELLADALEKCAWGETRRLIINLPPRSLKSICASVAFPAWILGHDPSKRIICVSYSDDLAGKHARDCRAIMDSDWYKELFAHTRINPNKRSEGEYETTRSGARISTSIGGTLTGMGGSMIIIDDPLKPQDALSDTKRNNVNTWYNNTLFSRLDNKETGCIIIVMQRIHLDDLVGFVQMNEEWTVLNLPAIAMKDEVFYLSNGKTITRKKNDVLNPNLESAATLATIRANIGSYNFSAQYQQEPIPESGNIIKWEWFPFYDEIPNATGSLDRIVQSWDTGMTEHDGSDYSACITFRQIGTTYYILDVYREKLSFPALKKEIIRRKKIFGADVVIIEDKGSGTGMIQQLKIEGFHTIAYKPEGCKEDRIVAQSARIEAGSVFLPAGAPWLDDFRTEIISFPYGRHDDQIDALSQGLYWMRHEISIFDVLF
jgi:predicted phage terminase large subunit-like protein